MATLTESRVVVRIEVRRDETGGPVIFAVAQSMDANNNAIRTMRRNITEHMSAARITGAGNLLTDVEAWVKSQWSIV